MLFASRRRVGRMGMIRSARGLVSVREGRSRIGRAIGGMVSHVLDLTPQQCQDGHKGQGQRSAGVDNRH